MLSLQEKDRAVGLCTIRRSVRVSVGLFTFPSDRVSREFIHVPAKMLKNYVGMKNEITGTTINIDGHHD